MSPRCLSGCPSRQVRYSDCGHDCKDCKISTEKIANALGASSKTIKRYIKEMDNVTYNGRGFSGHCEITDNE